MRKVLEERQAILTKKRQKKAARARADKRAQEEEDRKQYERLRAKFEGDQ